MNTIAKTTAVLSIAAIALLVLYATAERSEILQSQSRQTVEVATTVPISGATEFERHCALCHGVDGRGAGSMTEQNTFKIPPADLTQIAKRNNGVFPAGKVAEAIGAGSNLAGHTGSMMLPWSKLFTAEGGAARAEVTITEITKHVEGLQNK